MPKLFFIFLLLFVLTACPKQIDETRTWSAQKFYQKAHEKVESGDWSGAIENFEKLQGRYPYSKQARQAEIETIYAYYKFDEHDSAISSADRFINENPEHPNLDYIYYLRAIVQYNKDTDTLSKWFPQNIAYRDIVTKQNAYRYFSELIEKFPKSNYYEDSILRMNYLRNKAAEHELLVARFYFERQAFVASINRSKKVLREFPKTPATTEALHILKNSYQAIGLPKISAKYKQIIANNNLQNYQRITPLKPPGIIDSLMSN